MDREVRHSETVELKPRTWIVFFALKGCLECFGNKEGIASCYQVALFHIVSTKRFARFFLNGLGVFSLKMDCSGVNFHTI